MKNTYSCKNYIVNQKIRNGFLRISDVRLLTSQEFMETHWKPPPPPLHGSLKDMLTEKLWALVKDVAAATYAVGDTLSANQR